MTDSPRAFNPDALYLSKNEVIQILTLLIQRWEKNPDANKLYIMKLKADLFFLKRVKDKDFAYYWQEFFKLVDEVRVTNAMQGNPELVKLAQLNKQELASKITTVPQKVEIAKPKKIDLQSVLKYGAMKESA